MWSRHSVGEPRAAELSYRDLASPEVTGIGVIVPLIAALRAARRQECLRHIRPALASGLLALTFDLPYSTSVTGESARTMS